MAIKQCKTPDAQRARGITDADVLSATASGDAGQGVVELVDGLEPGLRLKVSKRGARWYVLAKGADGLRARIPLGDWPGLPAAAARSAARTIKQNLSAMAVGRPEGEGSVGAVFDRYDSRRLAQLRKGVVMGRAVRAALDGLRHRQLSTITRNEISQVIDELADRAPISANRTLAYLKAFFSWAVGRGYIEGNPVRGMSKPTKEIARERTPTIGEIAEIWVAADRLGYPFGPVVKLLILTASRREEVGAMRIAELRLSAQAPDACWTIPADRSKNGRALRIPLSALACGVLAAALEARSAEGPFVFTTTSETAVSGWSRAKSRLDQLLARDRAERAMEPMPAWRFHDIRRAFATSACDVLGVDPAVADRCLNHVGSATTSTISRVYARNEMYDQRRDALDRWGALVAQAVAGVGKASLKAGSL